LSSAKKQPACLPCDDHCGSGRRRQQAEGEIDILVCELFDSTTDEIALLERSRGAILIAAASLTGFSRGRIMKLYYFPETDSLYIELRPFVERDAIRL
jgi:hypothetical protein